MAVKYFEINGVKLKLKFYKLYYWYDKNSQSKIKNPYWREKKIHKDKYGYLRTTIKRPLLFHRIVYYAYNQNWDFNDGSHHNSIDHIDRNPLNNNIFNLRKATLREQSLNRDITTNAKGYTYNKNCKKKYGSRICLNYKTIYLGRYNTEQEASNKHHKIKLFVKVLKDVIYK